MKHPTDEALVAHCCASKELRLGPAQAVHSAVAAHMERGCDRCEERIREIALVLEALAAPPLAGDPPEAWLESAAEWLRRELATAPQPTRGLARAVQEGIVKGRKALEEIRAVLVLDSHAAGALAGVRGVTKLEPRQMLYRSPLGNLHLQVVKTSGRRVEIQGQFLPARGPTQAGGVVVLEVGGHRSRIRIAQSGEFRLRSVPTGNIRLSVEWAGRVMTVEALQV